LLKVVSKDCHFLSDFVQNGSFERSDRVDSPTT
jgi:hypothetical protein